MSYFFLYIYLIISPFFLFSFDQVVIWGHKLHSHTHSYIHDGFYRAFEYLGYKTYWFDNKDDVSSFNFKNTLFITEGQVDDLIPLQKDGIYLIHNPRSTKYNTLKFATFQIYTDEILNRKGLILVQPFIYYDILSKCVYMPWATDLLPFEIDEIKKSLPERKKEAMVYWIGTIGNGLYQNGTELKPFVQACIENGIDFLALNPSATGISREKHIEFISQSYMAPAIVGTWQKDNGYIPCRIFKNISYGQLGITNSLRAYELFDGKVVYNSDSYQLFFDAQKRINSITLEEIYDLMDIVKDKHTFLNRVDVILKFVTLLYP